MLIGRLSSDEITIFERHKILLTKDKFKDEIDNLLKTNNYNPALAVDIIAKKYIEKYENYWGYCSWRH